MIRNLLATTALATLVATAAYAQQDPATAPAAPADTAQPAAPAAEQPVMKSRRLPRHQHDRRERL